MSTHIEAIPVIEPGELLPDGTTFIEVFGLDVSEESILRLRERLSSIDAAERATDKYLNLIIGSALVGRTIKP